MLFWTISEYNFSFDRLDRWHVTIELCPCKNSIVHECFERMLLFIHVTRAFGKSKLTPCFVYDMKLIVRERFDESKEFLLYFWSFANHKCVFNNGLIRHLVWIMEEPKFLLPCLWWSHVSVNSVDFLTWGFRQNLKLILRLNCTNSHIVLDPIRLSDWCFLLSLMILLQIDTQRQRGTWYLTLQHWCYEGFQTNVHGLGWDSSVSFINFCPVCTFQIVCLVNTRGFPPCVTLVPFFSTWRCSSTAIFAIILMLCWFALQSSGLNSFWVLDRLIYLMVILFSGIYSPVCLIILIRLLDCRTNIGTWFVLQYLAILILLVWRYASTVC